jgi:hypothetical protein
MGNKGSQTTTTNTSPNPYAMTAYNQLIGGAQGVVNQNPFQTYGGEFVAGINPQQYGGIGGINRYAESAQPAISAAEMMALSGATPISSGDIQNYYNPWQQNVVGATEAQFQNMNAQQQQQVLGNAALQGALGGDRVGVAQANLAGQQQLSQAPVIAGLESQGFNQAAQLALAAKQQQAQGAYSLGNLGVAGQQAGLTGAGAQIQAGTLEQQNKQQLDAALYNQFLMQQAFPYQQWQWLAGIDTGVGSQMGGTSTTTGPPPSLLGQLGGLGLGAIGVLGGTGGFGPSGYLKTMFGAKGGGVNAEEADQPYPGFADGGVPVLIGQPVYGGVSGFLPPTQLTRGAGPPKPPGTPQSGADKMIADAQRIASAFKGTGNTGNRTTGAPMDLAAPPEGPVQTPGMAPEAGFGEGAIYARGGLVDRLPHHNRINVPARAGFGIGGFIPHRQEGGDVIELPPDQVPGEVSPEAMAAWRASRDLDLPPQITGGTSGEALPFAQTGTPGLAPAATNTPIANRILERYGSGAPPATLRPGVGESVPWSSAQSNIWPSLMAAGLGMMASKSPFPGVAVGEGGLRGLETYQGLGREQRAEAMNQQKINQAADNLALHAEQAQKHLALQTKQFEEAKRQHREPFGWTKADNGKLVPTPGGPHDPETIRAEAGAREKQFGWTEKDDGTLVPTPGGPHDPDYVQKASIAKAGAGLFSPETVDTLARQALAGDKSVFQNLGRGVQGPMNIVAVRERMNQIMRDEGKSGPDIAAANANFAANVGAARVSAQRAAQVEFAVEEAKNTFPLALEASAALPRTSFVPWNKAVQMVQAGSSSPALARYVTALRGTMTAYSQAMSRTGTNSVHAQQAAEELLRKASSHEEISAVLDQMGREMEAAKIAPETVRQAILARISGKAPPPSTTMPTTPVPAGGGAAPAPAKPATVIQNGHTYTLQPDGTYK